MKAAIQALAPVEDKIRDAFVGISGTGIAVTLQGWQSYASIFAAVSTGLWMITQAYIAIRNRLDSKK